MPKEDFNKWYEEMARRTDAIGQRSEKSKKLNSLFGLEPGKEFIDIAAKHDEGNGAVDPRDVALSYSDEYTDLELLTGAFDNDGEPLKDHLRIVGKKKNPAGQ